ncbi:DUF2180 family protein [Streptomyces sp. PTM05]|uniref:DUF2180 family protein n=1 Tax=Streptantibioticus parmotrematis TaxID=2873249 RepID=A0ABS7QQP7_9ACTN|nr:DUF2180 family protein [Streptantibioticus parmotrematis]MBY8885507.1 DUF2180 family protein [Streptantibioticus parmotrematis]
MNCYDCVLDGTVAPAVAVCSRCGSGVCLDHVRVTAEHPHRVTGTGVATLSGTARRATCATCRAAERT